MDGYVNDLLSELVGGLQSCNGFCLNRSAQSTSGATLPEEG